MFLFLVRAALNTTDLNVLANSILSNYSNTENLPDLNLEDKAQVATDIFKKKCVENSGSDAAFEQAQVSNLH